MGYAEYLSHKTASVKLDQKTIKQWERGEITTEQAFDQYVSNNMIRKPPLYHELLFEHWLNSLGYRRSMYGKKA